MISFSRYLAEQKKYTDRPQAQLQGPSQQIPTLGGGATGGGRVGSGPAGRKAFKKIFDTVFLRGSGPGARAARRTVGAGMLGYGTVDTVQDAAEIPRSLENQLYPDLPETDRLKFRERLGIVKNAALKNPISALRGTYSSDFLSGVSEVPGKVAAVTLGGLTAPAAAGGYSRAHQEVLGRVSKFVPDKFKPPRVTDTSYDFVKSVADQIKARQQPKFDRLNPVQTKPDSGIEIPKF